MLERITDMLNRCDGDNTVMPPTELYCEGWLLRLVLDWHKRNECPDSPFSFHPDATWYSEGLLASCFMPRCRGDLYGETHTHGDGFLGHFDLENKAEIVPKKEATQLVLVEAKLGSKISYLQKKNIKYYDQVARNVCCLVHITSKAEITPEKIKNFAFYVIAPESEIHKRKNRKNKKYDFETLVNRSSIESKVKRRADDFGILEWYECTFTLLFKKMKVELITWESVLDDMERCGAGGGYRDFYEKCKIENGVEKS